jgi:hypothetical protein
MQCVFFIQRNSRTKLKLTKLRGLSPRANYADRATAACRRSQCKLFADRGCHVVSVADPYGRNLGFLDQSRYVFFQVVPQLYSRDWVDLLPDPILLRKSGRAENRTRTSGSVARNWPLDHRGGLRNSRRSRKSSYTDLLQIVQLWKRDVREGEPWSVSRSAGCLDKNRRWQRIKPRRFIRGTKQSEFCIGMSWGMIICFILVAQPRLLQSQSQSNALKPLPRGFPAFANCSGQFQLRYRCPIISSQAAI